MSGDYCARCQGWCLLRDGHSARRGPWVVFAVRWGLRLGPLVACFLLALLLTWAAGLSDVGAFILGIAAGSVAGNACLLGWYVTT